MLNTPGEGPTRAQMGPIMAQLLVKPGDGWEIVLPERRVRTSCETLDDAKRVAYLLVEHRRPCELIVYDADDRVIDREMIAGTPEPLTARDSVSESERELAG
jgi:hypothetical protein